MPKLMTRPKRFLLVSFAITIFNLSILGCAQKGLAQEKSVQKGNALNVDCRSCHTANGAAGAKDFSSIYANPKSHHSVGVLYPLGLNADSNYNQPDGRSTDIAFFDKNGNGLPDSDEIQLFGSNGMFTVECASCHKEHGKTPEDGNAPAGLYLRIDNFSSGLCTTCHRQ
jgi:cytochrome c553